MSSLDAASLRASGRSTVRVFTEVVTIRANLHPVLDDFDLRPYATLGGCDKDQCVGLLCVGIQVVSVYDLISIVLMGIIGIRPLML